MSLTKNLLAAVGLVFVIIIVLSVAFSLGGIGRVDTVAVVALEGVIVDATDISRKLNALAERDDVKAVVLRINSPGGAVGPSQELYSGIKRLRKVKTVVASMGTVAASGGYYAAAAAEKIVANPGTITGSIGVLVEFVDASELLAKIGIDGYVVKSGKYKDLGSPLRKMDADERAMLQELVNDVNSQFILAVAEGRGLTEEAVKGMADGRIFTGAQAVGLGLVDQLGDLTDAIDLSARLAGIEGKPHVIYPEKRGMNLLQRVFGTGLSRDITGLFSGLRLMYMTTIPGQ
jgi:protease-4